MTAQSLKTDRLLLRRPRIDDFGPFQRFVGSLRAQFVGGPIDEERLAWRVFSGIAGQWPLRGYGLFVLEDRHSGEPLGACGPWHPIHWPERELGWSLWAGHSEGKGYITEAATAIRAHLYADHGWTTLVSYIDPANHRSLAAARRLGCREDTLAARPDPGCVVYRHPGPQEVGQ